MNDLSPFGPTVMTGQGVGTTVEQFEKGVADGSIVGHIGFPESIMLIAKALELEDRRDRRDPRADRHQGRALDAARARSRPAGSRGCRQVGRGYVNGELKIHLIHPQQIHPELADQDTGDYVKIIGDPNVNMANTPEIPGGKGTYASTGNYIPLMKAAPRRHAHGRRHAAAALLDAHASEEVGHDRTRARPAPGDWVEVECVLLEPADRSAEPAARDGGQAAAACG